MKGHDMKGSPIGCKVKEVRLLTSHICELSFETEGNFDFQAGQYVNVLIPNGGKGNRAFARNYCLATPPEKRPMELCFELVGSGTSYLSKLRSGDTFKIRGPFGKFAFEGKANRHFCYLATGSGIGPFRSIVFSNHFKKAPPISATCVLGVENEEEIIYREEMERFDADSPSHHFIPVLSHPKSPTWKGIRGKVADCLKSFGANFPLLNNQDLILDGIEGFPWARTEFYLCGDGAMIEEVEGVLLEKGVAPSSIHQEVYFDSKEEPLKEAI